MDYKKNGNLIVSRLFPDENINVELKNICKKCDLKSAVVLSGIGQLYDVKLGYFKEKGDYSPELFNEPLELLVLTGNICVNNSDHVLHLHAVLGDENKKAIGGHFIDGKVKVTAELIIMQLDVDFIRKENKGTGLKDLFLE